MDSNGNKNQAQVGSTTTCGSERKDPGWKYARFPNEQDLNTIICIFCDKVTKGSIYRHKQRLVGGHRNAKKCTKFPVHVRQEMEDYMNGKNNQKEQLKMRNEDLYEDFEDIDEGVESRRVASNITRGGSNRGGGSVKRSREKGPMDHFFTPNAEAVVQNRSGKITQTTMNDAYKKEVRERVCSLISRWMYDVVIPFNVVTCSIDNFYGFLETLPMGFVRFVDMFYEFLCLGIVYVFLLIGLIFLMIFDDK